MCNITKQPTEFYKDSKNKDGRNSNCKECTKKQSKERYNRIKEDPIIYEKHLKDIAGYKRKIRLNEHIKRNNKNKNHEDL